MAAIGSRLGQQTAQRQAIGLTPALQQSIKLLELSSQALAELVAEAVAENPLLEWAEEAPVLRGKPVRAVPAARRARPLPAGFARLFANASRRVSAASGDLAADLPAGGPSLQDHLLQQLGADVANEQDRAIGRALIESLDEAGYLAGDPADLAKRLKAEPARLQRVLARLRQFDPPGVFARDLADCLALQLAEGGRLDAPMRLLLEHLDLLAAGKRKALMKLCAIDAATLDVMIAELRRLDPRPGLAFERANLPSLVPDLTIERAPSGGWSIELSGEPRLALNKGYPVTASRDAAGARYLKERLSAAQWLLRALDRRSETLLRVVHEIVLRQGDFLDHGVSALKPLSRRQIARRLDLHESTVSRAIANKHAATPRGIVALADFFAVPMHAANKKASHAPAAVRARLRRLIEGEPDGEPISDEALVQRLAGEGIALARRTVAKYRSMLKIAPAAARRREKTLSSPGRRST